MKGIITPSTVHFLVCLVSPAWADSLTTLTVLPGATVFTEADLFTSRLWTEGWVRYAPRADHSLVVLNTLDFTYSIVSNAGWGISDPIITVTGHYGLFFQYIID